MVLSDRQIAIKLETQEGVENPPAAADVLTTIEDPTLSPDVSFSDARQAAGTHAMNRAIPGRAELGVTAPVYLVGSRNINDLLPPNGLDALFQCCGMQREAVSYQYITLVAQVGTFVRGETVTWPGGNEGVVVNYAIKRGTTTVYLILDVGSDAYIGGALITGATSGATATPTADSSVRTAYLYRPVSRDTFNMVVSHASWPSYAAVVGDVMLRCNSTASTKVVGWNSASARIVAITGSNPKTFECELLSGTFEAAQTVTYYDVSAGTLYGAGGTAPVIDSLSTAKGPSATVYLPTSGIMEKILGARGTFGLSGQAGQEIRVNGDLKGQYQRPIDGGLFTGVSYVGAESVPRLELAALTIDGFPFPVQTLEIGMNGTLTARIDVHKANGVGAVRRTGRDPTLTMDPVMPVPALYDMVGKQLDNVAVVGHFQVGYAIANTWLGEFLAGQLMQVGRGERDGEVIANIEMKGRVVSGQDDHDFRLYAL